MGRRTGMDDDVEEILDRTETRIPLLGRLDLSCPSTAWDVYNNNNNNNINNNKLYPMSRVFKFT
jgi:hypothetical protein